MDGNLKTGPAFDIATTLEQAITIYEILKSDLAKETDAETIKDTEYAIAHQESVIFWLGIIKTTKAVN